MGRRAAPGMPRGRLQLRDLDVEVLVVESHGPGRQDTCGVGGLAAMAVQASRARQKPYL
jgi:alpha-galactosidase/6-phospho-beta-glucosidase family protein